MILKRILAALCLLSMQALPAAADERCGGLLYACIEPEPAQYSLIHPFHLPHVLQFIKDHAAAFSIDGEQQQLIDQLTAEVRGPTQTRQAEAAKLEKEISAAAFDGQDSRAQMERLGRLQLVKREIAEIHINFINQLRIALSPEQYLLLRRLAGR